MPVFSAPAVSAHRHVGHLLFLLLQHQPTVAGAGSTGGGVGTKWCLLCQLHSLFTGMGPLAYGQRAIHICFFCPCSVHWQVHWLIPWGMGSDAYCLYFHSVHSQACVLV